MRVKILEGMALQRIVISSTLGIEGIHAKDRHEVMIANTLEDYIKVIDYCYKNTNHLNMMAENARDFIENEFDNHHISNKMMNAFHKMLSLNQVQVSE